MTKRRYETPKAFENALSEHLRKKQTRTRTINDLRREIAFDRVLARLQVAAPDMWLLKGGVALDYRFQDQARTTLDIDLTSRAGIDEMTQALRDAAKLSMDDYFQVRVGEREKSIDEVETYRFNVSVQYADGKPFSQNLKIDVGFADPWLGEPERLTAEPLLEFAGIAPTTVQAVPMEQHLAEKLHAYTREYDGRPSSRVKDFVDMALMVEHRAFDTQRLHDTFATVFSSRGTHELPSAVPPPPPSWTVPYAKLAQRLPIPQDLAGAHRHVAAALDSVLVRDWQQK